MVGHDLRMHILYQFHGWLIFARVIALFMFVWPYVRSHILCTQLIICLVAFYSYLVSWLAMIWACAYYTNFTDGWFLQEIVLFMFVWPYVCPHILRTQLVICLLLHFIHIWYRDWPWSVHAHIIPISRMVDCCESYSPFHVPLRAAAINYFLH